MAKMKILKETAGKVKTKVGKVLTNIETRAKNQRMMKEKKVQDHMQEVAKNYPGGPKKFYEDQATMSKDPKFTPVYQKVGQGIRKILKY